jgi:hypothetical protein
MFYRITMYFEDYSILSFLEEDPGDYLRSGEWNQPYPNRDDDSIVFGLLEVYSQSEGSVFSALWEKGEPASVEIRQVAPDDKAVVLSVKV